MFASLSSSRGQRPDTTTLSQIDFETFTKFDNLPICVRGGVISDITAQRLQLPTDTSLKNIILQVGSNDCVNHNFDIEAFGEDYLNLVKVSKSICENVVVSGLCPRLDDREANINRCNIILQNNLLVLLSVPSSTFSG
jgi:hypothetical protein